MEDTTTTKHNVILSDTDKASLAAFLKSTNTWLTDQQAVDVAGRAAQWLATQIPAVVDKD